MINEQSLKCLLYKTFAFLLFDALGVCCCLPIIFLIFRVSLTFEMTKICDERAFGIKL